MTRERTEQRPGQALVDAFPKTAHVAALDVTKPEQISAVAREAESKLGSIDVLVNNAGVGCLSAIVDALRSEYEARKVIAHSTDFATK